MAVSLLGYQQDMRSPERGGWEFVDNVVHPTSGSALDRLTCIDSQYMTLPIQEGFNWADCSAKITAGEWYLVVFRSRHRADVDYIELTTRDEEAQQEARQAPGFLHYFIGTPNEHGDCLSFCLWESQQQARIASGQPKHQQARQLADTAYEYYQLERYIVRKKDVSAGSQIEFERLPPRSNYQ